MRHRHFSEIHFDDFIWLQPTRTEFPRIPFQFTKGAHRSISIIYNKWRNFVGFQMVHIHNISTVTFTAQFPPWLTSICSENWQLRCILACLYTPTPICQQNVRLMWSRLPSASTFTINIHFVLCSGINCHTIQKLIKNNLTNWFKKFTYKQRQHIERLHLGRSVEFSQELISIINRFRNSRHSKSIFI